MFHKLKSVVVFLKIITDRYPLVVSSFLPIPCFGQEYLIFLNSQPPILFISIIARIFKSKSCQGCEVAHLLTRKVSVFLKVYHKFTWKKSNVTYPLRKFQALSLFGTLFIRSIVNLKENKTASMLN